MNSLKMIILVLGVLVFSACSEKSQHGAKWGLSKLDELYYLTNKNNFTELETEFIPRFSSDKYEFRLYFPSLKDVRKDSVFTAQKDQIIDLLHGTKFNLTDLTLNEEIIKLDITRDNFFDNISFNRNPGKPLSCWLSPYLQLNKKHRYKVKLFIPPNNEVEKQFLDIVFIIGVGRSAKL